MMLVSLVKAKVHVFDGNGNKEREITLPELFSYPVRPDLIRRAFHASFTRGLQPKGRDPMAGKRTTAESYGINLGLARVPRVKGSGEAALAPNTVGGRLAFPPSTRERIVERINEKEKRLATISALAATANVKVVTARGHKSQGEVPIVVSDDVGKLSKAKDVEAYFVKIGLKEELERASNKRIRAGKGKMRGRRYKKTVGPLIVVHDRKLPIIEAASNLPGVDVVYAGDVSVIHLAPGGHPGRLTIFTESSLDILDKRLGGVVRK
jgi:50S ribosomal protein L4P